MARRGSGSRSQRDIEKEAGVEVPRRDDLLLWLEQEGTKGGKSGGAGKR